LYVGTASSDPQGQIYRRGLVSGSNVIAGAANAIVVSSGRPFDFKSAWITTQNTNAVRVIGLSGTNKVRTNSFAVQSTAPTRVVLDFTNVTSVQFGPAANYDQIIMDDVTVSVRETPLQANPWFKVGPVIFTTAPARSVVSADLDGDGWTDLAHYSTNETIVQLSNRDGTFRTIRSDSGYRAPGSPYLTIMDYNRDGRPDVLVPGYYAEALVATSNSYSIVYTSLRTDHGPVVLGGTFRSGGVEGANPSPANAGATGDFNRDGRLDYAFVYGTPNDLMVFSNDGGAGIVKTYSEEKSDVHYSMAVADFDRDGALDVAVANFKSGTVGIWRNDGAGAFAGPVRFNSGAAPANIVARDVTGDGLIDLVVRSAFSGLTVMAGRGDGSFAPPVTVVTGDAPIALTTFALTVNDFNNDGKPDIAFVSGTEIAILYNTAMPQLRLEAVGDVVRIEWPANFAREAVLESAPTLDGSTRWVEHPFPPLSADQQLMIFDSGAAAARFFRLRQP
jgi:hypothetical protein